MVVLHLRVLLNGKPPCGDSPIFYADILYISTKADLYLGDSCLLYIVGLISA